MFHDVSLIVVVGSLFFFVNGLAFAVRDRQVRELIALQQQQTRPQVTVGSGNLSS